MSATHSNPRTLLHADRSHAPQTLALRWSIAHDAIPTFPAGCIELLLSLPDGHLTLTHHAADGSTRTILDQYLQPPAIDCAPTAHTLSVSASGTHIVLSSSGRVLYARSDTFDALAIPGGRFELISADIT